LVDESLASAAETAIGVAAEAGADNYGAIAQRENDPEHAPESEQRRPAAFADSQPALTFLWLDDRT